VTIRSTTRLTQQHSVVTLQYSLVTFKTILVVFFSFCCGSPQSFASQKPDPSANSPKETQTSETTNPKAESLYTDAANFQRGGAYAIAIENWESFLKQFPNHSLAANASYYLGICQMQKNEADYESAVVAFEASLKDTEFKLRSETLTNLAWCLYQSAITTPNVNVERLKQSLIYLDQVLNETNNSTLAGQAMFYSGEISYRLGLHENSIQFFDRFLESQPDSSSLWFDSLYGKGVAQEESQLNSSAIKTYQQLLSSCKDNRLINDVRIRLGDLLLLEGDFKNAADQFRLAKESASIPTDRSYALFREAFSLVQLNQFELASQKYQELLQQYPDSELATPSQLANAQSLYRSGKMDFAEVEFRKLCSKEDLIVATESTHWLARIKMSQSRYSEAVKTINQLLERGAEGDFAVPVQMDLAEALAAGNSTEDKIASQQLFTKIYRQNSTHPLAADALFNAAVLAYQIEQFKDALSLSNEFLSNFISSNLRTEILNIKAESLGNLSQLQEANSTFLELIQTAESTNPKRREWILRASSQWNTNGLPERTLEFLLPELSVFSEDNRKAEALLLIGQAYLLLSEPEKALDSLQTSIKTTMDGSKKAEAAFYLGQALFDLKRTTEAVDEWSRLVENNPRDEFSNQARYRLAAIFQDQGNVETAARLYDEVLQHTKSDDLKAYARYGAGWVQMQSSEYAKAIETLSPLIALPEHPIFLDALLARGIAYRNLVQTESAISDLERCVQLSNTDRQKGDAMLELSMTLLTSKKLDTAISTLKKIVETIPEYSRMPSVLHELGWAYKESMQNELAIETFIQQLSSFPDSAQTASAAYYVGQQMYAQNNYDLACQYFELVIQSSQDPKLSEGARYRIAWALYNQEKYKVSEQAFQVLATDFPDGKLYFDARMMIGECRYQRKEYSSALDAYTIARNLIHTENRSSNTLPDPSDRQVCEIALLHGGQCAAQLERWEDAIQWYDDLRKRFPATSYLSEVFYEAGFANQQLGKNDIAFELLKEVAENYRTEIAARSRFMMGEIYFSDGKIDLAIPEFQRVMYGFGSENAPEPIKNWQAKSGFEAGRCGELILAQSQTIEAKKRAKSIAINFYQYVLDKHPNHSLASKSKERIEVLKVD